MCLSSGHISKNLHSLAYIQTMDAISKTHQKQWLIGTEQECQRNMYYWHRLVVKSLHNQGSLRFRL